MTKNINHALLWLKEFKTIWLPKTIVNDNVLVESISFKLRELEKLLLQNETDDDHRADDEEYHRTKLLNDHSSSNSDTEHIVVVSNLSNLTQEPPAQSLLTPPDVHNQPDEDAEQQAKQILLESSETSDAYESPRRSKRNPNSLSESYRPTIRLLRISAEDAERFLPVGWKKNSKIRKKIKVNLSTPTESSESITKGRKNKKNTLPVRKLLPTTTDETTDSSARQKTSKGGRQKKSSLTSPATTTSLRSITREHLSASSITSGTSAGGKKSKRKLHALNAEADDLITLGDLTSTHGDHTLTNNDCEPIPRHIGPNGILSQTRKLNETSTAAQSTTTTTTSTSEDDQPLKIQVQQKSPAKRGRPRGSTNSPNKRKPSSKKSPTKDHITTTTTNNTVVITYQETANDPSPPHDETTVAPAPNVPDPLPPADTLTLIDDDNFIDDDDQILNDMADESFFASFNMTHERTMESEPIPPPTVTTNQNYNIHDDGVEDISNDGIDPPLSSTNFIHGYPIDNTMMMQSPSPVNVPSYSYLLKHSSSSISSDSDDENDDNNNNIEKPMNNMSLHECDHTKRGLQSSSNSDASPVKKKAKIALKRRLPRSSSSSSSSDDATVSSTVTTRQNNSVVVKQPSPLPQQKPAVSPPPPPARIQIQRSSSSSSSSSPASSDDGSNGSDEILTKRTRQRRKKPVSNERSKILKQIQRKTEEKKNATTTTATTISPANDSDSQNDSGTKMTTTNGTRSKFQFSDEDDGETTESYEVEKNNDDDDDKEKSDDDDDDDDDTQEGKSPSRRKKGASGRKNIRKILDDKELDVQTQQAVEAERERRRRIDEKQKEYNDTLLQQSSFLTNIAEETTTNTNRGLVLEMDKTTNEPLIEVAPRLVEHLKPHQSDGIRFLWNNVYESIDAIQNKKHSSNGCILAHCMGLGKTLQVISLIHTVFNYEKLTKARTCLILCPINAALNWSMEFDFWLKDVEPEMDIYQMATIKANLRISHLNYWHEHGGVIIMGYDMYRRLANGLGLKNKKLKAQAFKCLVDPGPDVVVADEGHILKNAQTALAKCLTKIKTSRRIVLTGTPLQNNLIEYYCMVSFVKPNLLGSQQEYINRFVNPIQNGQHRDSSMDDVRLMKRRACVLHELLTGCVDRKDYSLLKDYLPPKFEYIINVRMSDLQSILYEMYLKRQATGGGIETNQDQQVLSLATSTLKKDFKSAKLFSDYQFLQKIWTHPFLLYPHFIDRWKKRMHEEDDDMIDDGDIEAIFSDEEQEMEELKKKNGKTKKTKKSEEKKKKNGCGFLIDNVDDEPIVVEEIAAGDVQMKSNERRASSDGSTTTIGSDSLDNDDDDDDDIEEIGPDEKEETDEIIKSYTTRSRTAAAKTLQKQQTNPSMKRKPMDVDVFDTGNDAAGSDQQNEGEKNEAGEAEEEPPWMDEMREQFWFPLLDGLPAESEFDMQLGGKFLLLKAILDKCAEIGDKLILFSRSLYALNYIERFLHNLQKLNEREYLQQCESRRKLREILASTASSSATSNGNEHEEFIPEPVEWVRDHDYFRMDGQTDVTARKRYARAFNDMSNIKARLFLISTLAGGIGINLVGSNRVIVFDASWNPSHDTQAIFRSYRFGQKKPVYIYRFLARGTMEEKIYQRQVVKQSLSQRVVDDHQLDRHFTENDIKELYKFTPESLPPARSPSALLTESNTEFNYAIPKDHLLLDLLYEHGRWIHSYHSHDSLLENKLEEGLSADERRTALEEYENLKRLPDQRQLAVQRMQQQQQLNALIAQQQYLASAATTVQQQVPEAQQLYLQFLEGLTPADRRAFDYSKMLQYAFQLGLMPESNNGSPTTAAPPKTSKRRAQKSTMSAPPKPSTSMTADSSTTASNDVILLESDHDDDAIDDDNEPIDNNNNNHHHP